MRDVWSHVDPVDGTFAPADAPRKSRWSAHALPSGAEPRPFAPREHDREGGTGANVNEQHARTEVVEVDSKESAVSWWIA